MRKLFLFLSFLPLIGLAHPGVGIVKDSKGNIYYTDLQQVWKISGGSKTIVVPDVHTHELHVDANDNLYGEGGYYDEKSNKFYHYLWVLRQSGRIDTVIGMKQAYITQDFSLSRDKAGNEYYIKRFLVQPDASHIFKKSPQGIETIFAKGNFTHVNWVHPQEDGTLLYLANNAVYRVDTAGKIQLLKDKIGNAKPSFKFSENSITLWGVWQDKSRNIYVAVFSDQTVRKISPAGVMTDVYKSTGNWTPLHGLFDNDNKLWVLEGSDKNDVRVTLAKGNPVPVKKSNTSLLIIAMTCSVIFGIVFLNLKFRNIRSK